MRKPRSALDLAALRAALAERRGTAYWRSLEELAGSAGVRGVPATPSSREQAPQLLDPVERRNFLKLMGASLALAGVERLHAPAGREDRPLRAGARGDRAGQAALLRHRDAARRRRAPALLVESHMGRPTKVEGNPDHPASLGATDVFAQASVLGLYDPDRSQVDPPRRRRSRPGRTSSPRCAQLLTAQTRSGGAGLRILTGTVTSPTLAAQIAPAPAQLPAGATGTSTSRSAATRRAPARGWPSAGRVDTHYRFDRADVVLSLDADFLGGGPASVRYVRDFVSAGAATPERR